MSASADRRYLEHSARASAAARESLVADFTSVFADPRIAAERIDAYVDEQTRRLRADNPDIFPAPRGGRRARR